MQCPRAASFSYKHTHPRGSRTGHVTARLPRLTVLAESGRARDVPQGSWRWRRACDGAQKKRVLEGIVGESCLCEMDRLSAYVIQLIRIMAGSCRGSSRELKNTVVEQVIAIEIQSPQSPSQFLVISPSSSFTVQASFGDPIVSRCMRRSDLELHRLRIPEHRLRIFKSSHRPPLTIAL